MFAVHMFNFSGRSLLTPQLVYVGCFLPQAIFALYFVEKWEIKLCAETMLVLIGGTTLFVVASLFFGRVLWGKDKSVQTVGNLEQNLQLPSPVIYVERWKLILLLIFQIISIFIYIVFGLSRVPGSTILEICSFFQDGSVGHV